MKSFIKKAKKIKNLSKGSYQVVITKSQEDDLENQENLKKEANKNDK